MSPKQTVLTVLSAIVLLFAAEGFGEDDPHAPRNVSPKEASALIRENAGSGNFIILDVRTPGEYAGGHLEGAVLIDYRSPSFREEVARLDQGKEYLVYCRTANRSAKAVGIMIELGFPTLYHLEGGIVRWSEEGLPVAGSAPGQEKR